jgi:hypothetical protein
MPLPRRLVNRNRSQVCGIGRTSWVRFRNGFYAGLAVAIIFGLYLFRLWQPQRQIELHNAHLLARIEGHDWKAVGQFVSETYQDRWGNNRALLLERLPQVFRAMGQTRIESTELKVRRDNGVGYVRTRIRVEGNGDYADYIQTRVNALEEPFEFEWQRGATWPWDWKLVSVRNPGLEISGSTP